MTTQAGASMAALLPDRSFIYSHIYVYRAVMTVLYRGRYRARFDDITSLIGSGERSVCDLCFGDTVIADWCVSHGIKWTGVDLNPRFCARARSRGLDVLQGDILSLDLPHADVFVIAGSLYHFHDCLSDLFDVVFSRTSRFIISEPIRNLSSKPGVIGSWSRQAANPGNRPPEFRYDLTTLLEAIRGQRTRHSLTVRQISVGRDILLDLYGPGRDPAPDRR